MPNGRPEDDEANDRSMFNVDERRFKVNSVMKTPPFLLLAALLFWGWMSGFLIVSAIMGVILEAARFTRFRWDLDDADFSRIWSFCVLLNVVLMAYVFTTNNEGGGLMGMLHAKNAQPAVNSGVFAATRFLCWLPMTMFAFIAAQTFNQRPSVPLTGISIVLRWRRRKGEQAFAGRYLNMSYPYFMACLFSAGIHPNTGTEIYYWGLCVLVAWALWSVRSRRFGWFAWGVMLALVMTLGVFEIAGINRAQRAIQNFNAQWMARFLSQRTDPLQSMTSMGRIGRLKLSAKIVIWLEPRKIGDAPTYLREASYRVYQSHRMAWFAGDSPNDFELLNSESDNTSWPLIPGKRSTSAVNITCYLNGWSRELDAPEGVLPLPTGCGRLENVPPNVSLKKNENGTVLAAGRGLLVFDAYYGPGATIDAPPDLHLTNSFDLKVPTNEMPALESVLAEMHLSTNASYAQKLRTVERFFLSKFTYSTWQGRDKLATKNATPLTRFLLTSRNGHCEYFATATVLLLRMLDIPARYAVGYYVHEPHDSGYVVRERDAHAWCLVWDPAAKCWKNFDTTPPSWVAIEEKRTAGSEWFADLRSWLGLQFAKFRWGQAHFQQYIFWSLIPVLLVLLYHIIFRRLGKLRATKDKPGKPAPIVWPGLDSEFYQLEKKLAARGVPRQTGEPLSDWMERALRAQTLTGLREPLQELLQLHYRHRFDPRGLSAADRETMKREVLNLLAKISTSSSSSSRR